MPQYQSASSDLLPAFLDTMAARDRQAQMIADQIFKQQQAAWEKDPTNPANIYAGAQTKEAEARTKELEAQAKYYGERAPLEQEKARLTAERQTQTAAAATMARLTGQGMALGDILAFGAQMGASPESLDKFKQGALGTATAAYQQDLADYQDKLKDWQQTEGAKAARSVVQPAAAQATGGLMSAMGLGALAPGISSAIAGATPPPPDVQLPPVDPGPPPTEMDVLSKPIMTLDQARKEREQARKDREQGRKEAVDKAREAHWKAQEELAQARATAQKQKWERDNKLAEARNRWQRADSTERLRIAALGQQSRDLSAQASMLSARSMSNYRNWLKTTQGQRTGLIKQWGMVERQVMGERNKMRDRKTMFMANQASYRSTLRSLGFDPDKPPSLEDIKKKVGENNPKGISDVLAASASVQAAQDTVAEFDAAIRQYETDAVNARQMQRELGATPTGESGKPSSSTNRVQSLIDRYSPAR